jgi:hypothetical protein
MCHQMTHNGWRYVQLPSASGWHAILPARRVALFAEATRTGEQAYDVVEVAKVCPGRQPC